jgi:hypothetical protein
MLTVDDLGLALDELKRLIKMYEAVVALPECEFKNAILKEIQRKLNRESVASTEKAEALPIGCGVRDPAAMPGSNLPYGPDFLREKQLKEVVGK